MGPLTSREVLTAGKCQDLGCLRYGIANMGLHSGKIKAAGNIVVEGYLVAQ